MDIFDHDVIRDLYDDLKKERIKYRKDLEERQARMKQIDDYLDGLLNKDENDVQVFLARKVENLYREDIEYRRGQRNKLSIECDCIEEYIRRLDVRIEKLKKLLSNQSSMLHVKHLLGPSSIDLLTDVIQKIKSISVHMNDDPEQTKTDLKIIEKEIYKVIDNLKNA